MLFADASGVVHRDKMQAVGEHLGEVGRVFLDEVIGMEYLMYIPYRLDYRQVLNMGFLMYGVWTTGR